MLKEWSRTIRRDTHALYLAARDPRTPWYAKALAISVAAYAFSPVDLIPDFIPVLGYVDDLIVLPLGILAAIKLIPPQVMAESRMAALHVVDRRISRPAVAAIVFVWVLSLALCGWGAYRMIVP